jgi:NADH-quinone oxidoreductase subunit M
MLTLLLLAIPLLAAGLLFLTGVKNARNLALGAGIVELLVCLAAFFLHHQGNAESMLFFNKEWIGPLGISYSFGLDGISLVMALLVALLLPVIIYASSNRTFKHPHIFYGLMLAMAASMMGAFTTTDGLLFYVFYEFALIPIYFMILYWSENPNKSKITLKFFIYTLFGSLFMLVSLLYLYNIAGSFQMTALYEAGRSLSGAEQGWVFAGFFIAFAVKIPVFPFHSWQPSTYDAAPTAGTMLLAGIMLKMASYGMIRLVVPALPTGVADYGTWALALSAISVLYASGMAIVQQRYKLLIAWSSIAHLGVLSAGILSSNAQGIQGGIMEMLSHGILSVALFFVYDILETRLHHDDMSKMGGIREVNPLFAFLFFTVVMGSVALPLTSGFVGEFLLLLGFYQVSPWLTAMAALTVVLGAVYMLRTFQRMMLGAAPVSMQSFAPLSGHEKTVLTILVILIIVLGVYPDPILSVANPSVESLLQGLNR